MNKSTSNVVPLVRPKDAVTLTPQLHMLWISLCKYIVKNGYGPTYQELADIMGLASKSNIHRMLEALEERGYMAPTTYTSSHRRPPRSYHILVWPEGMEP